MCGAELNFHPFSFKFLAGLTSEDGMMKMDLELLQDVVAELHWERALRADKVSVEVLDSVVTLSGEVGSYAERLTAERAARRVTGVKDISNVLEVHLLSPDDRTDKEILKSATNALRSLVHVPKDSIKVEVSGGVVSLTGAVDWQCQKLSAISTVANLHGIKEIHDLITINTSESSLVIQAQIEAALERCALAYARMLTVRVDGANVTLSGRVASWSERELAKQAAWGSPGVLKVIDQMTASF
jgi:osmotically-inducible protein OsmY